MKEVAARGGEWVYTDTGEAVILVDYLPTLVQAFKMGTSSLTIVGLSQTWPSEGVMVLAGINIGAEEITNGLATLLLPSDMAGASPPDPKPAAMRFTSRFLQFSHPANWLPTGQKPFELQTDIEEGAINILADPRGCATGVQVCLVTFALIPSSFFYGPVMIRLHPGQEQATLEEMDAQKWAALTEAAQTLSLPSRDVRRYEDLVATNSLELLELTPLTLSDGTPALQRTYRWRQVGLSIPLVSSYTLFKRNDTMIEFRTDFTEEEWATFGSSVQDVILSIEIAR